MSVPPQPWFWPCSIAKKGAELLSSATEFTVSPMHKARTPAVARAADIFQLSQRTLSKLAMDEVQGHPSKANPHQERFLFCVVTRKVESTFAAKEMTIKTLFFAGVLHR